MPGSSFQRTRRLSAPVLAFSLQREAEDIARKAALASAGRAAQTLLKDGPVRLTLVGLKDGTVIAQHSAPGPITVHVLLGSLRVTAGGSTTTVPAGSLIAVEGELEHDVAASGDSAFLLSIFMPDDATEADVPEHLTGD